MFPRASERSPGAARRGVLVVDDERLLRWVLRERLTQAGHVVVEAANGETALRELRSRQDLAVMLLDYRLPDIDGFEVLRRALLERPACRVIVMTAHAAPEHEALARALGAADYLAKPFDGAHVVALVDAAISRS